MQKLVPSLWFNRTAAEVADLYLSAFANSTITSQQNYPTEGLLDFQKDFAGEPLVIDMEMEGFRVTLTNADASFRSNPAISFMLNFDPSVMDNPRAELERIWKVLSADGEILMPLDSYDFSDYYGWCSDKFGVSWQLMLTKPDGEPRAFIMPAMLFTREARGKAATAREKYIRVLSALGESCEGNRVDYPDSPGVILFSDAKLAGVWTVINDSTFDHAFTFNEGVSFVVQCEGQEQLDAVWAELAATEQPCGWCKDEFGVSWQVIPANLGELMQKPDAYSKLMQMTKIEIDKF